METWRSVQKTNFFSLSTLADFLELTPDQRVQLNQSSSFSINVPRRLASKMRKQSITDPLFLQFVSLHSPKNEQFSEEPVLDSKFLCASKLLKKYEGRALLLVTSACAMHCRYCFRQNFGYEKERKGFTDEIEALRKDTSLSEIILSGGDPLSLSNKALKELCQQLDEIPHLTRLRFHTRFPIGIPERIDQELLSCLTSLRMQVWFVIHVNRAEEMDNEIYQALSLLQKQGIPVLCQTVLLKGVNDNEEALYHLFSELVDHGIFPYYLHQLDRVNGSESFEVSEERGHQLLASLRTRLSGYAIPTYVREIPGEPSKPPYIRSTVFNPSNESPFSKVFSTASHNSKRLFCSGAPSTRQSRKKRLNF